MSKSARKYLIAGNWKMNNATAEATALATEVVETVGKQTEVGVAICPSFTALSTVSKIVEGSNIQLGAQNMHHAASGAYTGEISASMLRDLFCGFVILGHSERREYFGETDADVNTKVKAALENNLKPILCIGETDEEREAEKTLEVVSTQLRGGLAGISGDDFANGVIAYEPVWAIGTGKTATPEMAQEVHAFIRKELVEILGASVADKIRILYGGSMKPGNAPELLDQPDIDGGLIGGAALQAKSFCQLVEIASTK